MEKMIHPRKSLRQHLKLFFAPQQLSLQAMLVPALLALFLFSYLPMSGIVISVKEYTLGKSFFAGDWVGLKFFHQVLTDDTFWRAARNTLTISCLHMIFVFPAPVLLALMFTWRLKGLSGRVVRRGAVLGVLLFLAYTAQTFGLKGTTPGKNAFLTAVYCVLVPFFYWAFAHRRPDRYNLLAAALCVAGVGLVRLTGGPELIGQFRELTITGSNKWSLTGTLA